jgi:uncharacterized membrane protein
VKTRQMILVFLVMILVFATSTRAQMKRVQRNQRSTGPNAESGDSNAARAIYSSQWNCLEKFTKP